MESNGVPHHVQISQSTHDLIERKDLEFEHRSVMAKGKGEIPAYVLKCEDCKELISILAR
jgi:hypothetical protein